MQGNVLARHTKSCLLFNTTSLPPDGHAHPQESRADTEVGQFEFLDRSESDSMIYGLEESCSPPLTRDEWFVFLDAAGGSSRLTLHLSRI